MTITEILTGIHKQRVELEVCQELQRWLLDDRAEWIDNKPPHTRDFSRVSVHLYYKLYGWDCDSIVVMNHDVVVEL